MGSRLRILPRMSLESRWTVIIATLLMLSMSVQPASADDNAPLLKVDAQIDGQTSAMAVAGSRLYLGIGTRTDVRAVSQPSRPVVVGVSAPLPQVVPRITAANGDGYLADSGGGRYVLVVHEP